jgi:hypothetical protein
MLRRISSMANEHIPVAGGCLCGAVRYESNEPPTQGYYCHCTICRRNYGGLFATVVSFPGSAFRLTKGELKHYRATSFARRGFGANCGSPLTFSYEGDPAIWIMIGSLDHPEDWPMTKGATWGPSEHCYADTKIPWHEISDGLPQRPSEAAVLLKAAKAYVARTS